MNKKYEYNGIDVTMDIYEKIRSTVDLLARESGADFDDELAAFVESRTYIALVNPRTLMWSESARYIADDYRMEADGRSC